MIRVSLNIVISLANLGMYVGEQISSEAGPATWLGSITSLLLHTLFDTTFRFSNLVVRAILPSCTAHLACQAIVLKTPQDGWQRGLKVLNISMPFDKSSKFKRRMTKGYLNNCDKLWKWKGKKLVHLWSHVSG